MKVRTIAFLLSLSALLCVAGLSFDSGSASSSAWNEGSTPLFAGLGDDASSADQVIIQSADGTTTVSREENSWTVMERASYPGRSDEVGRVLKGLATATRIEPKTKEPQSYARLGLEGTDVPSSPTVRVTVMGGERVLADLFVGNRRFRGAGESWYVREPEDQTVWAVDAKLRIPRRTTEWLQTELLSVDRQRIGQITIEHSGGERIELSRADSNQSGFEILNLPEGRAPKTPLSAAGMLGALAPLRIQDVASASHVDSLRPADTVTTFKTTDGLSVTCELWLDPGSEPDTEDLRCRLTPSVDEASAPPVQVGPVPDREADGGPTPEDPRATLEAEVALLLGATEGWIYTLPSWKKTSFTTSLEELLAEVESEDEVEEEAPATEPLPGVQDPAEGSETDSTTGGENG